MEEIIEVQKIYMNIKDQILKKIPKNLIKETKNEIMKGNYSTDYYFGCYIAFTEILDVTMNDKNSFIFSALVGISSEYILYSIEPSYTSKKYEFIDPMEFEHERMKEISDLERNIPKNESREFYIGMLKAYTYSKLFLEKIDVEIVDDIILILSYKIHNL